MRQAPLPPAVLELLEGEPPSGGWLSREFEPGLVSVIIPAYNRAYLIGETLASILGQTYDKVEVVVGDDGSTDDTQEVLAEWRERFRTERGWELRVLKQSNRGANAARNLAARESHGEYLNVFDSDDLMSADRLAAQVSLLRAGSLDMVHGPWRRFYRERAGLFLGNERRFDREGPDSLFDFLRSNPIVWSFLQTRELADRVGPFDERLTGGNIDSEYVARVMLQAPRMEYCPTGPIFQRRHLRNVGFHHGPQSFANVVYWLTRLERRIEEEGKLEGYRKRLARKYRDNAVGAYRDRVREYGDYCADKAAAHAPDYLPRRGLFPRALFRMGWPRQALRLQGWTRRVRRWWWLMTRRLGMKPCLEPVTRVVELPLRSGGEQRAVVSPTTPAVPLPPEVAELLASGPPSGGWLSPEFEPGLVSVVIPVYNGGSLIGETLASVLAQTHEKVEVLVVDDGSTDNTLEVVGQWRERFRTERRWDLKILRQEHRGQNAARNLGARESRGEYLNFFDADDLMAADRLAPMARALGNGDLDAVTGPWVRFYREGDDLFITDERRFDCQNTDPLLAYLSGKRLVIWACLLRRSLADRVGPFDERLTGGNVDAEYNVRMFRQSPRVGYCPAGPVSYRRHPCSVSFNLSRQAFANDTYWLTLLERSLEQDGALGAYRTVLARTFRRCAVNAYREGAGDLADYCTGKAAALDPGFAPRRVLLRKLAFRIGGLRLALRVQARQERLRRWRWRLRSALGLSPRLEKVTRVAELPLGEGGG